MKSLDGDEFLNYIKDTTEPVLVLVHADWCVPCQRFKPQFVRSSLINSNIDHVMTNADFIPSELAQWGVMSVPSVLVFSEGAPTQVVKERTAEKITEELVTLSDNS